jgi:hypothetical protein
MRPKVKAVTLPGGAVVHLREMTGAERDAFNQTILGADGKIIERSFNAKMVLASLANEDGSRLDGPDRLADAEGLPASILDHLTRVANELNKLGEAGVEAAKGN